MIPTVRFAILDLHVIGGYKPDGGLQGREAFVLTLPLLLREGITEGQGVVRPSPAFLGSAK